MTLHRTIARAAAVVFFATPAFACGACNYAKIEALMPSIRFWSLLAIAWFVANGVVRSATGVALPLQPRALGAIVLACVAVLFNGVTGLPNAVLLLLIPLWSLGRSLRRGSDPDLRVVRIIGGIAVVACAALALQSGRELSRTRTKAETIALLSSTAAGRHEFARLRHDEPASLDTYRDLLRLGDSTTAIKAAERIAIIGDPDVDLPLLEQARMRFGADDPTAEQIALAIQQLRARNVSASSPTSPPPASRRSRGASGNCQPTA